ncbi:hypothetical protein P3T39_000573 [Kitasatospora sp. GP82]|nr:hypothetical protein [Kitasatospora sp. GP82]MDH6123648.1 hypothetical protein [Kitasatospora sp. GP82]
MRDCLEEIGVIAEVTGFLSVYANPHHMVAYADGVRWIQPADLDQYDIHPQHAPAGRRLPRWHVPVPRLRRQAPQRS